MEAPEKRENEEDMMAELIKKPLFNPKGDTEVHLRQMIGGNTTNLNDFNNMKYQWVSPWYRQAMEQLLDSGGNQPGHRQEAVSPSAASRAQGL